jgi:pyruvate/2-oxoglutarate dehydrogenase complex dihydrolipoamide acyltransferase (E2) component
VEVGTIVAYIETEEGRRRGALGGLRRPAGPAKAAEAARPEAAARKRKPGTKAQRPAAGAGGAAMARESAEERLRRRSTPLVRRIAEEHDVDSSEVTGTARRARDQAGHPGLPRDRREAAQAGRAARPGRPQRPRRATGAPHPADPDFWDVFYGQVSHPEFPARPATASSRWTGSGG